MLRNLKVQAMKLPKIILVFILAFVLTSFKSPELALKNGIIFFKGTWTESLQAAKAEDKFIFLHVYATWCAPCKELKNKTFKDSDVGEYFNKNFINVRIDAEKDEGREIARKYQVTSYPTLFIVDYKGNRVAKTTGFMKPRILINFGRRVIP